MKSNSNSSKNKDKIIKIIRICATILTILWMLVIYMYSNQDSEESSATSMSVSYRVVSATDRFFKLDLQDERIVQIATNIEEAVRKIAHMIEYAILTAFLSISLGVPFIKKEMSKEFWIRIIAVFLICTIYAASDEIHQLFVPGRFGCAKDVCIDDVGVVITIGIFAFVRRRINK